MVTNNIYIKKTIVYYTNPTIIEKGRLDTYNPSTVESEITKIGKRLLICVLVSIVAQSMGKFI